MENLIHRRDSIILTTIEVINELGLQGMSTREIAQRVGISEATIFKHFKSKAELIMAVLDHYSQYDADIEASVRHKSLSPKEAILYIVKAYVELYENYPPITAITQAYDVLACDPQFADKIKHVFATRLKLFENYAEEAKAYYGNGREIHSDKLANIILGLCNTICLNWRLNGFGFSLKDYTLSTLIMTLDAFIPE